MSRHRSGSLRLAAAYPAAQPPARSRVAYGILVELGFPADRSTAALTCAQQLIATLR